MTFSNSSIRFFFSSSLVFNSASSGVFNGIRIGYSDTVTVSGNRIYNGSTEHSNASIYIHTTSSGGFKNIEIYDNYISRWGYGMLLYGAGTKGSVDIYNNIIII